MARRIKLSLLGQITVNVARSAPYTLNSNIYKNPYNNNTDITVQDTYITEIN